MLSTPIHDSRLTRLLIQQALSVDLVPWYHTVGGDQGNAVDSLENSLVVWGTGQLMTSSRRTTPLSIYSLYSRFIILPHCCRSCPIVAGRTLLSYNLNVDGTSAGSHSRLQFRIRGSVIWQWQHGQRQWQRRGCGINLVMTLDSDEASRGCTLWFALGVMICFSSKSTKSISL